MAQQAFNSLSRSWKGWSTPSLGEDAFLHPAVQMCKAGG